MKSFFDFEIKVADKIKDIIQCEWINSKMLAAFLIFGLLLLIYTTIVTRQIYGWRKVKETYKKISFIEHPNFIQRLAMLFFMPITMLMYITDDLKFNKKARTIEYKKHYWNNFDNELEQKAFGRLFEAESEISKATATIAPLNTILTGRDSREIYKEENSKYKTAIAKHIVLHGKFKY